LSGDQIIVPNEYQVEENVAEDRPPLDCAEPAAKEAAYHFRTRKHEVIAARSRVHREEEGPANA